MILKKVHNDEELEILNRILWTKDKLSLCINITFEYPKMISNQNIEFKKCELNPLQCNQVCIHKQMENKIKPFSK